MRIWIEWRLIGIVYTGHAFQLTGPRSTIKPLGVALLANRQGRIYKHFEKRHR